MNVETLAHIVKAGLDALPEDTKYVVADLLGEGANFLGEFGVAFDEVTQRAQPAPSKSEGTESGGTELTLDTVVGIMYDYLEQVEALEPYTKVKGRDICVRDYKMSVVHNFKLFMNQWWRLPVEEREAL